MLGRQFSWQAEENQELEKINNGKNKNPSSGSLNSLPDSVFYHFSPKIVVSPLQSKTGRNAHKKEVAVNMNHTIHMLKLWFKSRECSRSTKLLCGF